MKSFYNTRIFLFLLILSGFLLHTTSLHAQLPACGTGVGEFCEGFLDAQSFSVMGTTIQTSSVPATAQSVKIRAIGGDGGADFFDAAGAGGRGAIVIGSFTVSNGEVLDIHVGEEGGSNSGGGGTGVRINPSTTFLIAGGGGGGLATAGLNAMGTTTNGVGQGGIGDGGIAGGAGFGGAGGAGFGAGVGGAGVGGGGGGSFLGAGDAGGGGGGDTGGSKGGSGTGGDGGTSFVATTNDPTNTSVEEGTATDGSDGSVCICYSSSAVPVELMFLKGAAIDGGIQLAWQTASEQNNEGFEIERSLNAKDWKQIGFVAGNGTTVEAQNYSYLDESAFANLQYYRLKQIDYDGQYEYSDIIAVRRADKTEALSVYPNPVQQSLNYQVGDMDAVESVQLYDIYGKLLKTANVINGELSMADVAVGTYILVVQTPQKSMQQLVVKR